MTNIHAPETPTNTMHPKDLVGVYYQTSAKYRTVVRLPEGKTGVEALAEASGRPEWAQALGELHAGDQYLRCYSAPGERLELSRDDFIEYRRLGGGTYTARPNPPKTETEQLHDALRALEAMTSRCRELEQPRPDYRGIELRFLQQTLDQLVTQYEDELKAHPELPLIKDAGFSVVPDPTMIEWWGTIAHIVKDRCAEVDELAAWRVAELHLRFNESAARALVVVAHNCAFAIVVRADGSFENPALFTKSRWVWSLLSNDLDEQERVRRPLVVQAVKLFAPATAPVEAILRYSPPEGHEALRRVRLLVNDFVVLDDDVAHLTDVGWCVGAPSQVEHRFGHSIVVLTGTRVHFAKPPLLHAAWLVHEMTEEELTNYQIVLGSP